MPRQYFNNLEVSKVWFKYPIQRNIVCRNDWWLHLYLSVDMTCSPEFFLAWIMFCRHWWKVASYMSQIVYIQCRVYSYFLLHYCQLLSFLCFPVRRKRPSEYFSGFFSQALSVAPPLFDRLVFCPGLHDNLIWFSTSLSRVFYTFPPP